MRLATSFLIGLIFGLGILISGMANPAKVLNFFDLAGHWDPSLALVMAGALGVAAPGYALLFRRRAAPRLEPRFDLPTTRGIDAPLILGSTGFGLGWGIAGFCPGAALPALGSGMPQVLLFVAALIAGMLAARALRDRFRFRRTEPARA